MLSKRNMLVIGGLVASVGIPLSMESTGEGGTLANAWKRLTGGSPTATVATTPRGNLERTPDGSGLISGQPSAAAGTPGDPFATPGPRLEGQGVYDPGEVLRFDISPSWVLSRWSRATTVGGEPNLSGYRVPLVTGPNPHDLAGSLTYYFNGKQQVQRISFLGTTGDPATLVALVTRRFGFAPAPSPGPGTYLYQIRWHNQPRSELKLRMADVIRADIPFQRFDVDLEVNLPDVPPSRAMHGETALWPDVLRR